MYCFQEVAHHNLFLGDSKAKEYYHNIQIYFSLENFSLLFMALVIFLCNLLEGLMMLQRNFFRLISDCFSSSSFPCHYEIIGKRGSRLLLCKRGCSSWELVPFALDLICTPPTIFRR